jgi:hypothetical protein
MGFLVTASTAVASTLAVTAAMPAATTTTTAPAVLFIAHELRPSAEA